jgi:hypothetical protein
MYQRMIVEGKMYLPKEADANSDYIADILQGSCQFDSGGV